jgi:ABC-type lipoprotein export system ATPase subunit
LGIENEMSEPQPSPVLLWTEGVVLQRDRKPIARLPDLRAEAGQTMALIGASGAGKSTGLLALAGVRAPAAGDVAIGSTFIWRLRAGERDRLRGQKIGLVFQSFHLVDALTVEQNVALAARCIGRTPDRQRLQDLLGRLDIFAIRRQRVDRISRGQAQRVAVARAIFNRPSVILADEPTSSLDDVAAERLIKVLQGAAAAEKAALVIATHDARVLAAVDRVHAMEPLP